MKKLISFLAFFICALTVNAQATHNMKITFLDGNTVVYGMENVKTVEFVEKEEPSAKETYTINGVEYPMPEAVDLGLPSGTKWASMNLGAKDSYDVGGYYGWADPTGKLTADDYNCRGTADGDWDSPLFGGLTPPLDISGTEFDLATRVLGNGWSMPSIDDIKELSDNCIIIEKESYVEIIGKNKNSIIMPFAYIWEWVHEMPGYVGFLNTRTGPYFWTSSLEVTYIYSDEHNNYPSAFCACIRNYAIENEGAYRKTMIPIRPILVK